MSSSRATENQSVIVSVARSADEEQNIVMQKTVASLPVVASPSARMAEIRFPNVLSQTSVRALVTDNSVPVSGSHSSHTAARSRLATDSSSLICGSHSVSVSELHSSRRRRRIHQSTMAQVKEVVTFEGQEDLLRASKISTVMRCMAALFGNGEGSAETYALSEQVTDIKAFISHNWAIGRVDKFFCLALRFNLVAALVAGFVALAIAGLIGIFGGIRMLELPPIPLDNEDPTKGTIEECCNATVLVAPVFLLVAFFGQDLLHLAGFGGRMVFLDKTCIHQTDLERQRRGILKLGAFLRSSKHMVAIYSDIYLTKLWTVYEVACFLSLHPASRLKVIPTFQPVMVFGGAGVVYVASILERLLFIYGAFASAALVVAVANATAFIGFIVLLRMWARKKEAIYQRVANFQVEHCSCFLETDRPLVQSNIARLLRATGDVSRDATEEHALTAFNSIVRTLLPRSLIRSIGPLGLHYRHVIAILLCSGQVAAIVDTSLLGIMSHEEEWHTRWRVSRTVFYATQVFGLTPLVLALGSHWCGLCVHLSGCQDLAFVSIGCAFIFALYESVIVLCRRLQAMASFPGPHRDAAAVGMALLLFLTTFLAIFLYRQGRQPGDEENVDAEGFPQAATKVDRAWEEDMGRHPVDEEDLDAEGFQQAATNVDRAWEEDNPYDEVSFCGSASGLANGVEMANWTTTSEGSKFRFASDTAEVLLGHSS